METTQRAFCADVVRRLEDCALCRLQAPSQLATPAATHLLRFAAPCHRRLRSTWHGQPETNFVPVFLSTPVNGLRQAGTPLNGRRPAEASFSETGSAPQKLGDKGQQAKNLSAGFLPAGPYLYASNRGAPPSVTESLAHAIYFVATLENVKQHRKIYSILESGNHNYGECRNSEQSPQSVREGQ